MPKVSVVVPIYNVEKYLRECLDSIVGQTLKDIEIICVDDGSTDRSLSILREYEQKDSRIKVITKPNAGYGHSMNMGLDAATGEYMGIVDSDDYILPDMYETLYSLAKENHLDFVRGAYYKVWHTSLGVVKKYEKGQGSKYCNRIYCPHTAPDMYMSAVPTPAGIYNINFLRENNIRYHETPGAAYQDHGFWFKTHVLARRVLFVDTAFYMYRFDNPSSSMYKTNALNLMANEYDLIQKFVDEHQDILCTIPLYWKARYYACKVVFGRSLRLINRRTVRALSKPFTDARANNTLDTLLFSAEQLNEFQMLLSNPGKYATLLKQDLARKAYYDYLITYRNMSAGVWNQFAWYAKNLGLPFTLEVSAYKVLRICKHSLINLYKKCYHATQAIRKKINPSYAKNQSAIAQMNAFVGRQHEADYRASQKFWWTLHEPGETLLETKKRFFMNMPPATGKLRQRQVEYIAVLEALAEILEKNDIPFWPMGGTMIGMLRHNAFVPWDDDIDISMLSKDREKLYEVINASDNLRIEEVYWCSAKTVLRCPRVTFKSPLRSGLIDIFFWEQARDEESGNKLVWAKRNLYVNMMNRAYQAIMPYLSRLYNNEPVRDSVDKKLLDDIIDGAREKCLQACGGQGTTIFGSVEMWFNSGKWIAVYDKNDLYPFRTAKFEGRTYCVPCNAERFLTDQYGDWMEIPSKVRPAHGG